MTSKNHVSDLFLAILLTVALTACGCDARSPERRAPWPTDGWATSSPEDQGLDGSLLAKLHREIESGKYGYVDRLVVVRNGYIVVNARYENDYQEISRGYKGPLGCGKDACNDPSELHQYNYYHPDWHPYYQGRDVHTLQSATKSVSSTLIGIAIGRGEIDGTSANLLPFFEDYDLSRVDDRLRLATLADLLTMRSGIEWHEIDRPLDATNTTTQLEASEDWIQFTLDQPMDADPGEKWVYNSGGSHLMSGVIKKATGMYADAYAEKHLFGPLGIHDYHWKKTPKGFPDTLGGLYLEAEQLAKIGYLYLNNGLWGEKRILPEDWVEGSTMLHVGQTDINRWGYGYQWWRLDRDDVDVWAALGFGTQALLIIPRHRLVGVVNCWNIFEGEYPNVRDELLSALIASAIPAEQ